MPLTQKTKTLKNASGDAVTYTITPHPAEEGFELLPKVVKVIGRGGGPLLDAFKGALEDESAELDGEALGRALVGLADEIVAQGGAQLCKEILKYATRQPPGGAAEKVAACFNVAYQANYLELGEALIWALEVNFAPFLRNRFGGEGISEKIASLAQRIG